MNIALEVIKLAQTKKITISTNESMTGGLIMAALTEIPGASKVISGGLISYQKASKIKVSKVNQMTIKKHGTVSSETALEMAVNGQKMFASDICLSITGNAGPDTSENKVIGEVYLAVANKEKVIISTNKFNGTRQIIRQQSVKWSLEELKRFINKNY